MDGNYCVKQWYRSDVMKKSIRLYRSGSSLRFPPLYPLQSVSRITPVTLLPPVHLW